VVLGWVKAMGVIIEGVSSKLFKKAFKTASISIFA
jgi:hypothetical protein